MPLRRVYGNVVSPYARKVYLTLEWKGLEFEAIDVLPHDTSSPFREISPLGKIPAFEDARVRIADSTVICDYLETRHPERPLYPKPPEARARALWLEEWADTRLQDLLLRGIVVEKLIKPQVRGEATDEARLKKVLEETLPAALDYLDARLGERTPGSPYLVGETLSIADLAVTTGFINAEAAGWKPAAARRPRLVEYLDHVRGLPLFAARARVEADYLGSLGR